MLDPNDTIRAYNDTDTPITVGAYTFAPGQSKFVSFLWMRNHYGDPRSIPSAPRILRLRDQDQSVAVQPRQTEVMRINCIWGIDADPTKTWADIPALQFFDEDNVRIITVFDDPSGESVTPHSTSEKTFIEQQDRIAKLEQTLDLVLKATGVAKENLPFDLDAPDEDDSSDIPTDESTTTRTTSPWESAEPDTSLMEPGQKAI